MGQTQEAILQIKLAQTSPGLNFQLLSILNERLNLFTPNKPKQSAVDKPSATLA